MNDAMYVQEMGLIVMGLFVVAAAIYHSKPHTVPILMWEKVKPRKILMEVIFCSSYIIMYIAVSHQCEEHAWEKLPLCYHHLLDSTLQKRLPLTPPLKRGFLSSHLSKKDSINPTLQKRRRLSITSPLGETNAAAKFQVRYCIHIDPSFCRLSLSRFYVIQCSE